MERQMKAEREKRAVVLESEGERQSSINVAFPWRGSARHGYLRRRRRRRSRFFVPRGRPSVAAQRAILAVAVNVLLHEARRLKLSARLRIRSVVTREGRSAESR